MESGDSDLAQPIAHARRSAPRNPEDEQLHAWADSPDRLEGSLTAAWRGQTLAYGAGADQPGTPWSACDRVGAIALRRGARHYGALVCAWRRDAGDAARRDTLDWLRTTADAALGAQSPTAEVRRLRRQGSALAELVRASVSSINLAEALYLLRVSRSKASMFAVPPCIAPTRAAPSRLRSHTERR